MRERPRGLHASLIIFRPGAGMNLPGQPHALAAGRRLSPEVTREQTEKQPDKSRLHDYEARYNRRYRMEKRSGAFHVLHFLNAGAFQSGAAGSSFAGCVTRVASILSSEVHGLSVCGHFGLRLSFLEARLLSVQA